MIDPTLERPHGKFAPKFDPDWLDAFEASHVVAFGTRWRALDYAEEAHQRLEAGERLPFVCDEAFYNDLLRRLLDERNIAEAALHYMESRGLHQVMQDACMTLAEAARRGQVISSARPATGGEPVTLPAPEWAERERFRFNRSYLFERGHLPLERKEWIELRFWTDDVRDLRANGLQRSERPAPVLAPVLPMSPGHGKAPQVIQFAETPTTLAAALREIEGRREAPSKAKLAQAAAALYWSAYGQGRARAETPKAVGDGIEKRWSSGVHARSLEWLLDRAARG